VGKQVTAQKIGFRIKTIRESRKLRRREVETSAGLPPGCLRLIEGGDVPLNGFQLHLVAQALGVAFDSLLEGVVVAQDVALISVTSGEVQWLDDLYVAMDVPTSVQPDELVARVIEALEGKRQPMTAEALDEAHRLMQGALGGKAAPAPAPASAPAAPATPATSPASPAPIGMLVGTEEEIEATLRAIAGNQGTPADPHLAGMRVEYRELPAFVRRQIDEGLKARKGSFSVAPGVEPELLERAQRLFDETVAHLRAQSGAEPKGPKAPEAAGQGQAPGQAKAFGIDRHPDEPCLGCGAPAGEPCKDVDLTTPTLERLAEVFHTTLGGEAAPRWSEVPAFVRRRTRAAISAVVHELFSLIAGQLVPEEVKAMTRRLKLRRGGSSGSSGPGVN
jgi:transcriptional regulator with XRE-family HTH domain